MTDIPCTMIPATMDDLEEIHALARKAARCSRVTDWDDEYPGIEFLRADIQSGGMYKAVHEGRILSFIHICPWADHVEDGGSDIDTWDPSVKQPCGMARFCVDPALQGQGFGRRMMMAAIDRARVLGYDGIRFHASKGNPLVQHLYDSMGFRRAGEITFPYGDFICYEMKL